MRSRSQRGNPHKNVHIATLHTATFYFPSGCEQSYYYYCSFSTFEFYHLNVLQIYLKNFNTQQYQSEDFVIKSNPYEVNWIQLRNYRVEVNIEHS